MLLKILTILKKFWREVLIALLVIAVSVSVKTCSKKVEIANLAFNAADSAFTTARYYRNKEGELVGQVKTLEITVSQLKKYNVQLGYDKKSLEKQVGSLSNLVSHWKGKVGTERIVIIPLTDTLVSTMDPTIDLDTGDPVVGKNFEFMNDYLRVRGYIDLKGDQLSISYKYKTDFDITAYYKSQGLFKPRQLVTDIKFTDPNFIVTDFKGFVIKPKEKWTQKGWVKIATGAALGFGLFKAIQ